MPDPFDGEDFSAFITTPKPLASTVQPVAQEPSADPFGGEDFSAFMQTPQPLAVQATKPSRPAVLPDTTPHLVKSYLTKLGQATGQAPNSQDYSFAEESAMREALWNNDVRGAEELADLGLNKAGLLRELQAFNTSTGDQIESQGGMTRADMKRLYDAVASGAGVNRNQRLLEMSRYANQGNNPQAQAIYEQLVTQFGGKDIATPDLGAPPETGFTEQALGTFQQGTTRLANTLGATALAVTGQGNYYPEASRLERPEGLGGMLSGSARVVDRMPAPTTPMGSLGAIVGSVGESIAESTALGPVASLAGRGANAVLAAGGSLSPAMDTYGSALNNGSSNEAALLAAGSSFLLNTATEMAGGIRGADRLAIQNAATRGQTRQSAGDIAQEALLGEAGGELVASVADREAQRRIHGMVDGEYSAPELVTTEDLVASLLGAGPGAAGGVVGNIGKQTQRDRIADNALGITAFGGEDTGINPDADRFDNAAIYGDNLDEAKIASEIELDTLQAEADMARDLVSFEESQARTVLDPEVMPEQDLQNVTETQELPAVAAARYDVAQAAREDADPTENPFARVPSVQGVSAPSAPVAAPAFQETKPAVPVAPAVREAPVTQQEGIDFETPVPSAPAAPVTGAVATQPEQSAETPSAPKPVAFPKNQVRGSIKAARADREAFGPVTNAPIPTPKDFSTRLVNVHKDAGQKSMHVKDILPGVVLLQDPNTGKAMIGTYTDAKGRKVNKGSHAQIRPLDAKGVPSTISRETPGMIFDRVEDAVRYAGRNFMREDINENAAESAAQEIGGKEKAEGGALNVRQGKNIGVTKKAPSQVFEVPKQSPEAKRAEMRRRRDYLEQNATRLTDEEVDEYERLDQELKTTPEPSAPSAPKVTGDSTLKAVPGSPLTPKMRQDLSEEFSGNPDINPQNAGRLVANTLEEDLGRPPTPKEWSAAVKDLRDNGVIPDDMKVERGTQAGASFLPGLVPMLAKIAGVNPGGWLRERFAELTPDNQAVGEVTESVKPGQYGYTPRQIAKFVTRALGMRGTAGGWIVDVAGKLNNLLTARTVAAMFPEFRPVLSLIQNQIDQTRIRFQESFEALTKFRELPAESRFKVNAALIQFRLEGRSIQDYDKPFTYTDERGRTYDITLSGREVSAVVEVFSETKRLLEDYVDALRTVFSLPPSVKTAKDLEDAITAGLIEPSAKALLGPMRILESGNESYVPLKRHGNAYRAVVYDATKYNAAKTKAQRKAAQVAFLQAESNADLNRKIQDASHRFPGALVLAYEEGQHVQEAPGGLSAKDLSELAQRAGVPESVLQDFLDAGVGSYLETRGIRARFTESQDVPGFDHDMLRSVASHMQAMVSATERLRHRHAIELSTSVIKDPGVKRYAQRFTEIMDTPTSQVAQSVRQITTLYYLGLGAISALVNSSTSLFFTPVNLTLATRNPVAGLRAFGNAVREQFNALAHIMGNGLPVVGSGVDQVEQAAMRFQKMGGRYRGLANAIREKAKAGVFTNVYEREADAIAERGQHGAGSKIRGMAEKGLMHFFAKVETANRLSAFIAAYQQHEENAGVASFDDYADNIGFSRGGKASDFAEFFSDHNNFRMDKTDMPSWALGSFKKLSNGKEQFTPSTWRPMAYALKGWGANFVQQQLMIARAAWKGGWIDRSLYAALMMAMLALFGAQNMVPGLQSLDAMEKTISGDLETTSEEIAKSGAMGRIAMKGLPGYLGETFGSKSLGDTLDMFASRAGPGNVVPTLSTGGGEGIKGVTNAVVQNIAPLSVADGMIRGLGNLVSGDKEMMREGAGQILGKEATRAARAYNQVTGSRGYTTKSGATLVPSQESAAPGMPFLSTGDIINSLAGGQPPVVQAAYRMQEFARNIQAANDGVMENAVNTIVDGILAKDDAMKERGIQSVKDWNSRALESGETWKVILPDALEQAAKLEMSARKLGPMNLQKVPTTGRKEYLNKLREITPPENLKPQ